MPQAAEMLNRHADRVINHGEVYRDGETGGDGDRARWKYTEVPGDQPGDPPRLRFTDAGASFCEECGVGGECDCANAYVHELVWESHRGPIPDGSYVAHINGDTLDNRLANLELRKGARPGGGPCANAGGSKTRGR